MSEELTRKRRVHGGHRASAKRILGKIQTSISSQPTDIARIAKLQQSIEDKLQVLAALDEFLALTENDAVEEEIVSKDKLKELFARRLVRNRSCPETWRGVVQCKSCNQAQSTLLPRLQLLSRLLRINPQLRHLLHQHLYHQ